MFGSLGVRIISCHVHLNRTCSQVPFRGYLQRISDEYPTLLYMVVSPKSQMLKLTFLLTYYLCFVFSLPQKLSALDSTSQRGPNFHKLQIYTDTWQEIIDHSDMFGGILRNIKASQF